MSRSFVWNQASLRQQQPSPRKYKPVAPVVTGLLSTSDRRAHSACGTVVCSCEQRSRMDSAKTQAELADRITPHECPECIVRSFQHPPRVSEGWEMHPSLAGWIKPCRGPEKLHTWITDIEPTRFHAWQVEHGDVAYCLDELRKLLRPEFKAIALTDEGYIPNPMVNGQSKYTFPVTKSIEHGQTVDMSGMAFSLSAAEPVESCTKHGELFSHVKGCWRASAEVGKGHTCSLLDVGAEPGVSRPTAVMHDGESWKLRTHHYMAKGRRIYIRPGFDVGENTCLVSVQDFPHLAPAEDQVQWHDTLPEPIKLPYRPLDAFQQSIYDEARRVIGMQGGLNSVVRGSSHPMPIAEHLPTDPQRRSDAIELITTGKITGQGLTKQQVIKRSAELFGIRNDGPMWNARRWGKTEQSIDDLTPMQWLGFEPVP